MKPAIFSFLKKFSLFLIIPIIVTILGSLFFFFATPHLTKPAHAQLAQSCAVASSTVQQGGSIGLAYQGVAAGYQIFIWDGGSNRYNYSSNTVDSTTAQQWISIPIPANAAPGNNYYGFIGTPSPMTCKTTGGTAFSITASSYTCTNNTPSVAPGGIINVTIHFNGNPKPGNNIMVVSDAPATHLTPDPFNTQASDGATIPFTVPTSVTPNAPGTTYNVVWALVATCSGPLTVTSAAGAYTCTNNTPSVAPGGIINVTIHFNGNPKPGNNIMVVSDAPATHLTPDPFNTQASDGATIPFTVPTSVTPNAPGTTYNVVWALVATCSGPLTVGAAGGSCTYTFTPQGSVAAGSPVKITILTAPATDTMVGGISNGTTNLSNTRTGPGTITVNAPASGSGYLVYATDQTAGNKLCAVQNGVITAISITGGINLPAQCTGRTTSNDPQGIDQMNNCVIAANRYDDKPFVKNFIFGLVDALGLSMTGYSRLNPEVNQLFAGTGAVAATGKMVAALYQTEPASGVEFFARKIEQFNPIRPAYAQGAPSGGIGFSALQPVLSIWEAFRNISYVGFIIIFIVVGFMIMFRAHISPQAVATIQDSIPRIVIAIILVTFSYAIAGLMIDIMFLFLNVILNALAATKLINNYNFVFEKSVFDTILGAWGALVKNTYDVINEALNKVIRLPSGLNIIVDVIGGGIAALVVGVALLFIMFRIFFMLLMAYIQIIVLTISAPFFFLLQALPGQNSASTWFKQMASNVAVFPTVAMMFVLVGILAGISDFGGNGAQITGQQVGQFPLMVGGLKASTVSDIIGLGILFMIPEAANLVKQAFGQKGGGAGFGAGAAMAGLAGGMAVAGAAGRGAWDRAYNKGPLGQYSRVGQQMRQERETVEARSKVYEKTGANSAARQKLERYGIGYKP